MKSVADELRRELTQRSQSLTVEERIELSLRLGDDDVALFAAAERISPEEARSRLQKRRQLGRRTSIGVAAVSSSDPAVD
jgi:hypothetical protein